MFSAFELVRILHGLIHRPAGVQAMIYQSVLRREKERRERKEDIPSPYKGSSKAMVRYSGNEWRGKRKPVIRPCMENGTEIYDWGVGKVGEMGLRGTRVQMEHR